MGIIGPINAAMTLREQIIIVHAVYCRFLSLTASAVSKRVFGRGTKIDDIESGGDLSTRIFERAMQWFSDNWPDGCDWPQGVPRPVPQKLEAAQ